MNLGHWPRAEDGDGHVLQRHDEGLIAKSLMENAQRHEGTGRSGFFRRPRASPCVSGDRRLLLRQFHASNLSFLLGYDTLRSVEGLFDARVRLCIEPIGAPDPTSLPAEERALIAKAVPKRRREFAAGRLLARRMLSEFGRPPQPLLRGEHGAVPWPKGIQASISHCEPWVAVAMTASPEISGVGLDVEYAKPLEEKYWHVIMTSEDICHLESWPEETRATVAKRMFGAKEAAYKAQYPTSQEFLPFSAMWIAVGRELDTFEATFRRDAGPWRTGDVLPGRFLDYDDHVLTAVIASRAATTESR